MRQANFWNTACLWATVLGLLQARLGTLALAGDVSEGASPPSAEPIAADLATLSLEELSSVKIATVYGASKFEQKITEAPSSVTVVSADEIKRYGYRTLADVLQSLQGFHVSNDRNYAFLGARGVSLGDFNSRVLVLVDGHRINNNLTDGAYIDTAFILDLDLVDRVEVIRGPGSALYGNNAFFGVINVITRQGAQLNGVEASGEYGTDNTYKARATFGKQFTNGVELLFSGTYYESDGQEHIHFKEFNTPTQNYGVADGLDDDSFYSGFGSLSYRDFTLEGGYIRREKGNPTAQFFTTFNDSRLQTTDERSYAALKYAHSFTDVADVTAQVYYDRCDFEIEYPYGTTLFKEDDTGEWWGTELQVSKHLWDKHIITAGGEYRDDFRQDLKVYDQTATYTDFRTDRQSYGVYAQGDFEVRTNLHFNGGVRYDKSGEFDGEWNPRLAVIYNAWEKSTFKAIYGTAFRAPNFIELSDPRYQNIQPETITSYELVYEQGIGKHLRSSIAGYYNQMEDLIIFEDGNYNNMDAEARGVETALEASWPNGIQGRVSYTYQQTDNLSSDRDFPDSPQHLFKFNLSVPLWRDKFFAGFEYLYTSDRLTVSTTSTGMTVPGEDADGFGIFNLTLFSKNLVKNLECSASVYNLLDESYADPSTRSHLQDQLPREGRSFRVKLTYRF